MLKDVKMSLRMTGDALNDDMLSSVNAALLDMSRVGIDVSKINLEDPTSYDALTFSCVSLYCKWIYNFLQRGEEWRVAYERLRDAMSLCAKYSGGEHR